MQSYIRTKRSAFSQLVFPAADPIMSPTWNRAIWSIIIVGVFLRLFHYLDNRSFWIDEIYLNTSLIKMSFWELATKPLCYEQKAPLGYLWLVRLMILLFGKGEAALRLVSLLCGLASLVLFVPVARHFLKPPGIVIAIGIMAFAPPLIYHSVEAKQYGMELLATILCLLLYIHHKQEQAWWPLVRWGFGGAIILWFSHSSIFILVGIAVSVSLTYLFKKAWQSLTRVILPFFMWMISFSINYLLFTYKSVAAAWLTTWFAVREGFMPLPPTSFTDAKWFLKQVYNVLDYPLGMLWKVFPDGSKPQSLIKVALVVASFLLVGISIATLLRNNRQLLIILTLPLLLTLLASGLKVYPFYERLTIFLAPLLIMLLALGSERIWLLLLNVKQSYYWVVPVLLLGWPLGASINQLIHPALFGGYKKQYYKEALLYLNQRYQEGDAVYVYWNTLPAYWFYKDAYNLKFTAIEGKDMRYKTHTPEEYLTNNKSGLVDILGKKRVWFIYERSFLINIGEYDKQPTWYWNLGPNSGDFFYSYVAGNGKILSFYKTKQHVISLLDLSTRPGISMAD